MSDTLSITPSLDLSWSYVDTIGTDVGEVNDVSSLKWSNTLADGTGADQADVFWRKRASLLDSNGDVYDLNALTVSMFGKTVTLNFQGLKSLYLECLDTTTGYSVHVKNFGSGITNPHTALFHGSTNANIEVPAGGVFHVVNKKGTWACASGANQIQIYNDCGYTVEYVLMLMGTTA